MSELIEKLNSSLQFICQELKIIFQQNPSDLGPVENRNVFLQELVEVFNNEED